MPVKMEVGIKNENLERWLPIAEMEVQQVADFFNDKLNLAQYIDAIRSEHIDGATLLDLIETDNLEAFIARVLKFSERDGIERIHHSRIRGGVKKHQSASRKRNGSCVVERSLKRIATEMCTPECTTVDLTGD